MGNLTSARSVIVTAASGDAGTVKALLAIHTAPDETPPPMVAELADEGLARSLEVVIGPLLTTVRSEVMVAELTAQACRQRGVATVFSELLDVRRKRGLPVPVSQSCRPVVRRGVPRLRHLGRTRLHPEGLRLNPATDAILGPDDAVIAVSEDDATFVVSPVDHRDPKRHAHPIIGLRPQTSPRRLALVGWSHLGARVVSEMDEFMLPDTVLDVIIDPLLTDRAPIDALATYNSEMTVVELSGGSDVVADLVHSRHCHQVIILGLRDSLTPGEADARTLLTVLALHTHAAQVASAPRIVVELLDQRHTPLARATGQTTSSSPTS